MTVSVWRGLYLSKNRYFEIPLSKLLKQFCRHLVNEINCFTLFATHFHELTDLAKELPAVGNLNLSAVMVDDKLALLYKVNEGICDQSFGINVAQLADFPQHIIEVSIL